MKLVGILEQPRLPDSSPLAQQVREWLSARGVPSWSAAPVDDEDLDAPLEGTSLLIVLGGDGSTLRAARWTVPYGVPIFGINVGRVGFLSEATPENWPEKLSRLLDGDYWIERRLLLHAELWRDGGKEASFSALNEVVIGRGAQARVIHLHLRVDDDLVTTYIADALIVATPTGSTAYAMAAGGPLMPPQLQNLVVVPVAAHLSLNRSLVLHENARISIQVEMGHEAFLTADGQKSTPVEDGDEIIITKNDNACSFARIESPGYFYRRLMGRLGFSWPHLSIVGPNREEKA
ncbi:MAG: NAD(+)/NADH kinase [Anaerolineae bacterium]|uniref:NAD(+)/NADH kinase n=1 Tax=Promineifilum sp. TaxID=2664178 RepID=UPI001D52C526|nr:NAD(+)/NADH kinase [Anaerolineales bacterium]MCB8934124.1 NAD(+)/NADH kinase [Promineifilum sp.]MCO5179746.1 NAD(+)/NADH kinase [Promineifilum sp.]MCW5845694.1 NAD(+)/NADH kinase [Anaerolineae bacterium]